MTTVNSNLRGRLARLGATALAGFIPLTLASGLALRSAPPAAADSACPNADIAPAQGDPSAVTRAEDAVVCLTNEYRAQLGLPPLSANEQLRAAAEGHSADMVSRQYFAHNTPEGTTPGDRMNQAGYCTTCGGNSWGENIAWQAPSPTPSAIFNAWFNETPPNDGHRRNILDATFTEVGVGLAFGAPKSGNYPYPQTYTQDFGAATPTPPPPPPPPATAGSPKLTAGADANNNQYVFWQGTDGGLWEKWYINGSWYGPANLNMGTLGSAPTVAVHPDGEQDVFWKGTDGGLWEAWWTGQWNGPVNLAAGQLGSGPTAGADANNNQYVFWQGTDGGLWEKWYINGSWYGPANLNMGQLGSGPSVAVHPDGEQDVFWKGTDGGLWEGWFAGGQWNGPVNLAAGQLGSGPTAGADANNNEYVFWQGTDGGLWEKWYINGSWYGPGPLNVGTLGSAPAVAVHPDGEQDVFWKGGFDTNLWETWWTGQWNGVLDLGPLT